MRKPISAWGFWDMFGFRRPRKPKGRGCRAARHLHLEPLEEKALLAVVSVDSNVYMSEGGSAMLNFYRDSTGGDLTAYFSTMNSTAEPEDYYLMPDYSVTFYDGFSSASTYIYSTYDMDGDNDEFSVEISYGMDYTIDPYFSTAYVTISDPDAAASPPYVWFDSNVGVDEGYGVEVLLHRDTTVGEVTVNYNTTDITAELGDYYFMSTGGTTGWATFWDGYDTASDWLNTADDADGDDEQLSIDLIPSPDYYIMGGTWATIEDHEAPVATDNDYFTPEDTAVMGNVLTDDTGHGVDFDPNGDPLSVDPYPISAPYFGTVTLAADGSFTYTPVSNYCGNDSFGYYVWDNEGGYSYGTVTVTMNPVNDPPEAYDAQYTASEDMPAYGSISYYDVDGDALTISIATGGDPQHGDVQFEDYGTYSNFTYTPDENFFGEDSFTFKAQDPSSAFDTGTVAITVMGVNDVPVAAADTAFTEKNQSVTIANLLTNDTDVDGDMLTIGSVDSYSAHMGTIVNNGDGTVLYTPAWDFTGSDSFTYMVTDNMGGYAYGTVSVTIADGPMVWMDTQPVTIVETGSAPITLHRNRSEGELTVTLYTSDSTAEQGDYWVGGTASFGDGQTEVDIWPFAYDDSDPDDEIFYVGLMDAGSYTIDWSPSQAEITIDDDDPVTVSLEAMVTVVENDAMIINMTRNTTEGDTTVYFRVVEDSAEPEDYLISGANSEIAADGSTIYSSTILSGYTYGSFTIQALDDEDGNDETLTIEVTTPDDGSYAPGMYAWVTIEDREPPVATEKEYVTFGDGTATGNLLTDDTGNGQDSDPNGDMLTVQVQPASGPSHGTVAIEANGDFTYTANTAYEGTDSFAYIEVDTDGLLAQSTVFVQVQRYSNVNITIYRSGPTPTAVPDDEEESVGAFTVINFNDTDGDGTLDYMDPVVVATAKGRDEVDLMRLDIHRPLNYSGGPVTIRVTKGLKCPNNCGSNIVKFWIYPTKKVEIPVDENGEFSIDAWGTQDPITVWIEVVGRGLPIRGIEIEAEYAGEKDTVTATPIWAGVTASEHSIRSASAVLQDPLFASLPSGDGPRQALINFGGTGLRPYQAGNGVRNLMLMRFTVEPAGVQNERDVQFDITRRVDLRTFVQGGGTSTDVTRKQMPEKVEEPNDDTIDIDESDEPNASAHMFVTDQPGVLNLPGNDVEILYGHRANFEEFLRVSFDGEDPTGNEIMGSIVSPKYLWHSRHLLRLDTNGFYRVRTTGDVTETDENDIGEGHIDLGQATSN